MLSQIFEILLCPKCKRKLKPSVPSKESIETFLECRYCKICVKTSLLRTQKNPQAFIDQFKKIPEGTEIKLSEKYKMRDREEHEENLKKYKHTHTPEKCPFCDSIEVVADCGINSWICLSCDSYFQWVLYEIALHGTVSVLAPNEDLASEKAYSCKNEIDFESFVIREE